MAIALRQSRMIPSQSFAAYLAAAGDTSLLAGETDGLAIDFTSSTYFNTSTWLQLWNQKRASSVDTYSSPHTFYQNAGTSPKVVKTSSTGLGWSPHNLVLRSQELGNAAWSATAVTITTDDTTAPDASVTAEKAVESNTSSSQVEPAALISVASGVAYTMSGYFKPSNNTWQVLFGGSPGLGNGFVAWFNISAGTVGTLSSFGTGWNVIAGSGTITNAGNGWYRCSVAYTTGGTTTDIAFATATADNSSTRVSSGTYWAWGLQLNRGIVPTAYVATTSAAVMGLPISFGEGLWVEPAGTNVLLQSQDITVSPWNVVDGTRQADQLAAPDGSTTADLYTLGGSGDSMQNESPVVSNATVYTASVYLKAGTATWVRVDVFDSGFSSAITIAWFNVATGTLGTVTGTAGSIQSIGNGWYRCTVTATSNGVAMPFRITCVTGDNSTTRDTGKTLYVWGSQLETGTIATSYIPTVAASVTRAVDKVKVATSAFPTNASFMSQYAQFKALSTVPSGVLMGVTDDPADNVEIAMYLKNGTGIDQYAYIAGAQTGQSIGAISVGVSTKVAYRAKTNDFRGAINGSLGSQDASGTIPTGYDTFGLGYMPFEGPAGTIIQAIIVVPRAYSDAELQAKTT